jgi:hypothetical protein
MIKLTNKRTKKETNRRTTWAPARERASHTSVPLDLWRKPKLKRYVKMSDINIKKLKIFLKIFFYCEHSKVVSKNTVKLLKH